MSDSLFPILETEPLADGIGMLARQARIGGTMTEQQRLTIRAELARRMGWKLAHHGYGLSPDYPAVPQPRALPDPLTNAADKDELVKWLAADSLRWSMFRETLWGKLREKHVKHFRDFDMVKESMTASPETITLAAARALGIQEAE